MNTAVRAGIICLTLLFSAGTSLHAQRGPGGGGGGPGGPPRGMGPGGPMGGFSGGNGGPTARDNGRPPAPNGGGPAGTSSTMRGGLQLGPPGRWWDDKNFAMSIGITKDQQKKMDNVFNANKNAILDSYKAFLKEESKLEAATRDKQPDRAKIFSSIDSVNQARSALEKANAQMQLEIRKEMDADQISRMDKFRDPPQPAATDE